ncbi:MAG: M6 family metalloprotease domain-containing protein [Acidobacteriia bacterium]|nr:M6 family metalloprotease domain-containing protein [Terriglobia bacterium]
MPKIILKYFFLLIVVVSAAAISRLDGALLRNLAVTFTQPDGAVIHCLASGDEFYNWLHDENGFTIIQDPVTGYYTYAVIQNKGLASSEYIVGRVDPASLGLLRNTNIFPQQTSRKRSSLRQGSPLNADSIVNAPRTGTLNNIVIFIRFGDDTEFSEAINSYDAMFNSTTGGENSLRNYYAEVSYNQLAISTTFYPAPSGGFVTSYQDLHPRGYFRPYNAITNPIGYTNDTDRTNREHALLANAVAAIASQVPPGLNIDGDGDGNVDNVCFIVKGSPEGGNDLLWPHMRSLSTLSVTINSKRVFTYNFQLENSLGLNNVSVLAHEMFHSLGAPDLYHHSFDVLSPADVWDVMAYSLYPPQHMTAYMKMRYGTWLSSIPTISTSGTYSLNPLTSSTNNAFKILSPNSTTEYFVVEYRKKTGTFESSLPGEGLIVYRINTSRDGQGNEGGPPDELYVYRPGGNLGANGSPELANFNSTVGRTAINDSSDPSSILSTWNAGGLNISNVTAAGDTISFTVSIMEPSDTVTIQVPPSANLNPINPAAITNLWVWAKDSQGHPLIYAWTASCPGLGSNGSFSDPNVRTPSWIAPSNTTGSLQSCTMQVTVSDGHGHSTQGSYSQGVGSTTPGIVPHFFVSGIGFVGRQHGQTEVMGYLTLTCDVPGIFPSSSSFVVTYSPIAAIVNSNNGAFITATAVAPDAQIATWRVNPRPPGSASSMPN